MNPQFDFCIRTTVTLDIIHEYLHEYAKRKHLTR